MEDLIQKLMISKKIMERHDQMDKTGSKPDGRLASYSVPEVENFSSPMASYNIPQEFVNEEFSQPQLDPTRKMGEITEEKIKSSNLPDEIKRLMIEHPIASPIQKGPSLSNELVEKASKLMGLEKQKGTPPPQMSTQSKKNSLTSEGLKKMMRETMTEILQEHGLLTESESKTNELVTFRVGNTVFEGKITKIKKVK